MTTFQHLPGPAIVKPALIDVVSTWLSRYWQTLGMIVVARSRWVCCGRWYAPCRSRSNSRSRVRCLPLASQKALRRAKVSQRRAVGVQNVRSRLKRRTPHGPSLREELSELVKEDPDTAVNVLRAWIGNSGNAN